MTIVRMFRLTKAEYFADFFITPPITAVAAGLSISHGIGLLWPAALIIGFVAWTFYEYAIHRWVLHFCLWGPLHRLHHERQRDYIAVHPLLTLVLYGAGWALFGARSSAFMVGFYFGYIAYSALHTAFHYQLRLPRSLLKARRRHVAHHRFETLNYGVLTSVWDRMFRTEFII